MSALLIQNIKQQTKRLIDQLNELQQLKGELSKEQYDEMKKETIESLETFQKSLDGFQKGEISLDTEIQKSKQALMNALKKNSNVDEIKKHFQESEIGSLRASLKNLETQLQMKQINDKDHTKLKMEAIIQIKSLGGELTVEQKIFISTDNQFKDKQSFEMNSKASQQYLGTAQKQISDKLKE